MIGKTVNIIYKPLDVGYYLRMTVKRVNKYGIGGHSCLMLGGNVAPINEFADLTILWKNIKSVHIMD